MQIINSYNTNTNISARVIAATTSDGTEINTPNTSHQNAATVTDSQITQITIVDEALSMRYEISELLQQFSEWVRVASESRRMEFIYNILLKESHRDSDLFGKIMDIARRIMRNEDVSPEEMRFLAEHNPQLLYVVTMLKDDSAEAAGKERRRARDRRGKDRRSILRRRDQDSRGYNSTDPHEIRIIERRNHHVPKELIKQLNSMLINKSIKSSYDALTKKKKHLSVSVNTLITNTHDID